MTSIVFFTLDIDPSFPWRSDIHGMNFFLYWLEKANKIKDFVCLMNFSGRAIQQIVREVELYKKLNEHINSGIIEIGNHGYSHIPLAVDNRNINSRSYLRLAKIHEVGRNSIKLQNNFIEVSKALIEAKKIFFTKHRNLIEQEITWEVELTNRLSFHYFNQYPTVFRAPFFASSLLVSKVIQKAGFKCDLSKYIEKKDILADIKPRKILNESNGFWEIDTSIKLDPNPWMENITEYIPNILPKGLSVVIVHPWEFSSAYNQSNTVKKRFIQMVNEVDSFSLSKDIIKGF